MKRITALILACLLVLVCTGCSSKDTSGGAGKVNVEMSVKDFGVIKLELDGDTAPITVANFVKLVNEGFYDGLTFHRVYAGFMIQGGDPDGGSSETINGEFSANGVENNISHERGVISMARSNDYDSASSQFFICHADSTFLDGNYAAFGHVTEGIEVVDKIAEVEVEYNAYGTEKTVPVEDVIIEYIKVID